MTEEKKEGSDLIISKARTRAAATQCSVASEFYEALDREVRKLIETAERRAMDNKRKTIKACDL